MDTKGIGARVAERRRALGMRQGEVGQVIGADKMRVSRIERGEIRVQLDDVPALAEALGVDESWLLGLDGAPEPAPAEVVALARRARKLDAQARERLIDELRRFRRPQARCAARLAESDNARVKKAS